MLFPALFAEPEEKPTIHHLITSLADPSFSVREQASGKLLDLVQSESKEIESTLMEVYWNTPDPEIRFRCQNILTELYLGSIGFLGIQFSPRQLQKEDGKMQNAIAVLEVLPNSAAKKAGLLAGDFILAVNGEALESERPDLDFTSRIKALGAGQAATLSLSRRLEKMELNVVLGRSPIPQSRREAEALFKKNSKKAPLQP